MIELSRTELDIGIIAHDTQAMLTFYGDLLGLPRVPGEGRIRRFAVGSNRIKILGPERPPGPPADGIPWDVSGAWYTTLYVTDVTGLVARLTERGVESPTGVVEPTPGIRYAVVNDPDGNRVELVEGA